MNDPLTPEDAFDEAVTIAELPTLDAEGSELASTMESLSAGLLSIEPIADEEAEAPDGSRTIGTFFIGQLEVALPADAVREGVPYPDLVTRVPLTPPSVHGVFSLRGEILPVIDATRLLGGTEETSHCDRRVAIIDIGESFIGVVFDRTGEVLRIDQREDFGIRSSGGPLDGMIESVIQLDEGARCIQLLSLDLLGRIPGVPYRKGGKSNVETSLDQAVYRKAVSVRVGHYELAFPVETLVEIQEGLSVQPSPEYFPHCRGVLQLRGRSFAVMNFRDALQMEETETPKKLVFVQLDGNTIALEVDSLVETLEFSESAPIPVPELPDSIVGAICGEILALNEDRHVLLIDVPSLFRRYSVDAGAAILGSGHEEEKDQSARLRVEEERAVFTFEVGTHALSLSMEHVLEVRSMPAQIVPAGSQGGPILGLIEIRGTVVPLIDMQMRLGLTADEPEKPTAQDEAPAASEEEAQAFNFEDTEPESVVVVVQHQDEPFGLVVDRVKSMTRFHPSEASSAATAFQGPGRNNGFLGCIESALLIDTPVHGSQTVVLLNVGQLVRPDQ